MREEEGERGRVRGSEEGWEGGRTEERNKVGMSITLFYTP